MERRASSSENLRSSGRASQRFSEVFSQGPTAIPAREDVDAALSSVLATDSLSSSGRPLPQQYDNGGEPPGLGSQTHATGSVSRTSAGQNAAGITSDNPQDGIGNEGCDFGDNPDGGGRGGGGVGGLINWALWPVWGTIDALKWAGGTVNEVAVAPVIRMASPWGLAGSVLTTIKAYTPQRARDLARVVGNFGLNVAALLGSSAGGQVLQSSGRAAGSLSTAISSPAGRQFLLESATGLVKLAEALDTPEVKNFIQQGAVVAARGMDVLASRHTKIFVKDLADAMVRLVELANSREATVMAAEFTVNVAHALEMEHMAGINRRREAEPVASDAADADLGPIDRKACATTSAINGGTGHHSGEGVGGDVRDEAVSVGSLDVNSSDSAAPAAEEKQGERKTMEALVREARLERARQEGSDGGGAGPSGAEGVCSPGRRRGRRATSVRALSSENDATASEDNRNREGQGTRECSCAPPIIRQADLKGGTPLSTFRCTGTTDGNRTKTGATPSPTTTTTPSSGGTAINVGILADVSRSAPSSPRSGRPSSAELTAATRPAPSDSPAVASSRERASTITGAGCCGGIQHTTTTASGHDKEVRPRTAAGVGSGGGMNGEMDGTESEQSSSCRPAVEYERDGRAKLPRFTSEHITSVLRGRPLGLEQQLEAPNEDSLDDTVARASRFCLQGEGTPARTPTPGGASGGISSIVRDLGLSVSDTLSGEGRGHSGTVGQSAVTVTKPASSWKHAVFACLLLLLAGDGLRHRWKITFIGQGAAASKNSSKSSTFTTTTPARASSTETASGVGGEGGKNFGHAAAVFGGAFLPPTCQDPASGRTMAVWATPSGPCLSPSASFGGTTEGIPEGVGGGPRCAVSFRLCNVADVEVRNDVDLSERTPARREL